MPVLALADPLAPEPYAHLLEEHGRLRAYAATLAEVASLHAPADVFQVDRAVRAADALSEGLARHRDHVERVVAPRVVAASPAAAAVFDELRHEQRAVDACVEALRPHLRALAAGRSVAPTTLAMAVGFVLDTLRPYLDREAAELAPLCAGLS